MNPFRRLLPPVLALLAVGCADALGPLSQGTELEVPGILAGKGNGGGGDEHDPAAFVLRHAPDSPALETYQTSFWAVKGRRSSASVDYSDNKQFLTFEVPHAGLYKRPDGSRIADGDSVLITLTIDPVEFNVTFAPSGLEFDRRNPAELLTWYDRSDPDYDRDGDVDADDDAIMENALSVFYTSSGGWKKMQSANDVGNKKINSVIPHFSGYAVSW